MGREVLCFSGALGDRNQESRAAAGVLHTVHTPATERIQLEISMTSERKTGAVSDAIGELAKVLYTGKTHTTGGRRGGASRSDDGRLDVNFSAPGTPGTGSNPEQLFAAGWSACLISSMGLSPTK